MVAQLAAGSEQLLVVKMVVWKVAKTAAKKADNLVEH
jgi:hypothetical protein